MIVISTSTNFILLRQTRLVIKINLYQLKLLASQKNYASSINVYFNIKHCYWRNLPQRDFKDLGKIQEWFEQHEPFNLSEGRLCSLSSGLTATDGHGMNCDITEEVGDMIPYFSYELAAIPTSLFRDSAMRKTQKSQLAKALTNDVLNGLRRQFAKI